MKVVIVDDEQLGIDSLSWELKRLNENIVIDSTFTDAQVALTYLNLADIDLLFLDIQMPNMNGFELLKRLNNITFQVVFVTAYDEFAIKAFQYAALDYLLKPAEKSDLEKAIGKFRALQPQAYKIQERLDIHSNSQKGKLPEKVVFATKETYEFIPPKEIMYCEALSNYTAIHTIDGKLVVSKTLKEVEDILLAYHFLRVHRSYLVNPRCIKRYVKTLGGSLIMENEVEISISKSRKEDVLDYLQLR